MLVSNVVWTSFWSSLRVWKYLLILQQENELQLLDNKSKADQIRVLTEQAEVVKRQHDSEIREKDKVIAFIAFYDGENTRPSQNTRALHFHALVITWV